MKPKLLWCGDAACPTGFARVTHNVLHYLQDKWDVAVIGINYRGDPHLYPYPIYPACTGSGDLYGISRIHSIDKEIKPDVILINNDPWNVIKFLDQVKTPVTAYMPVDALNMKPAIASHLNKLALAIFYTKFGMTQARSGGYTGRCAIVPHGVDTVLYRPIDKEQARKVLSFDEVLPKDAFVFGNVNRNQPRKRLDLTIQYFADWVTEYKIPKNVYLALHCRLKDEGWDLLQLAEYYGMGNRMIVTDDPTAGVHSLPEKFMPYIYNNLDVQISTTAGEGWGLTNHEGMACGIPQIVPEFSALAEWPENSVYYVPVSSFHTSHGSINTIAGIPDEDAFVKALDHFYTDDEDRELYAAKARNRAIDGEFEWAAVAEKIHLALLTALGKSFVETESGGITT